MKLGNHSERNDASAESNQDSCNDQSNRSLQENTFMNIISCEFKTAASPTNKHDIQTRKNLVSQ
jgi:hypothetical protein